MSSTFYPKVKRIIDISLSCVLIFLCMPIFLIASILIMSRMGYPIFFLQERVGLIGRKFTIIKFRTMCNEVGSAEPQIAHFGHFLRQWSIDELPQLINVLKGDMSLIGPRPLPVHHMQFLSNEEHARHNVRPGITGLAQISGRNTLTWSERFHYDLHYVRNRSLYMDAYILWKTIGVVMKHKDVTLNNDIITKTIESERGPTAVKIAS